MICFQISIFEPLKTARKPSSRIGDWLWFAFKLVSLNHWKQLGYFMTCMKPVVICFQISIFEPLKTASEWRQNTIPQLWFAFKLVSLNHWKQRIYNWLCKQKVVICFQISIFEPLKTATTLARQARTWLWFAFKLVSLNHWKQQKKFNLLVLSRCDLLSN